MRGTQSPEEERQRPDLHRNARPGGRVTGVASGAGPRAQRRLMGSVGYWPLAKPATEPRETTSAVEASLLKPWAGLSSRGVLATRAATSAADCAANDALGNSEG